MVKSVRIVLWVLFVAVCAIATWRTVSYVQDVDEAAVRFQALDHFNNSLR